MMVDAAKSADDAENSAHAGDSSDLADAGGLGACIGSEWNNYTHKFIHQTDVKLSRCVNKTVHFAHCTLCPLGKTTVAFKQLGRRRKSFFECVNNTEQVLYLFNMHNAMAVHGPLAAPFSHVVPMFSPM
ncbi:MAG: hypothetical protein ACKPKO_10600 [Candidatus Fonsibacter sp.]